LTTQLKIELAELSTLSR
jgi:hypothetical protein